MSNYPPPPYPRKPRYRVSYALHHWREVSDAELVSAGDSPADYLPLSVAPKEPCNFWETGAGGALAFAGCLVFWFLVAWGIKSAIAHL